jgi:hypothetical protein
MFLERETGALVWTESNSQMKSKLETKLKVALVALFVVLSSVFTFAWCTRGISGTEYRFFPSPDRRFKVVVYRSPERWGVFPGQSGDAPGTVCLFDVRAGKLLKRKRVEMVQTIDRVTWSATNVDIALFADWKLP